MKFRKILLLTFLISLFSFQNLNAISIPENISGITLSNQVYNLLSLNNFNPSKQNLVLNGKNNFPYNVILDFNKNSDIKKNVIFVFNQEEVIQNQSIIKNFCQECKNSNFPTTILFAYGLNDDFKGPSTVSGTNIYIKNEVNTSVSSTAIIINLSDKKNAIVSSSNGKTSPSWLVKSIYNTILKYDIDFNLPPYYLSQLYTFNFSKNMELDEFFNKDIPCVKLSFQNNFDIGQVNSLLTDIIHLFDENTPMNFDQHFLLLSFFGTRYFRMNEQFIVICVIIIVLIFLIFLFMLFFIDSRRRNSALTRLKNNWHPLVFTFIIIIASFLLGKGNFMVLQKNITSITRVFVLYMFQMIVSLILCFVFFTFEYIHNPKVSAQAVEYTVILSTFLNQFLFLYTDISLFPIFAVVCILAFISKFLDKVRFQIPIVILMTVPFLLYAYLLLSNSQIDELKHFLLGSEKSIFALTLVVCPIYLKLDCIFISLSQRAKDKKQIIITTSIIVGIFCTVIIALSGFYAHLGRKNDISKVKPVFESKDSTEISIKWNDTHIFDDTIRNLSIKIPFEAVNCEVRLYSEDGAPILYSDNSYSVIDQNTAIFIIPTNPPEKLWFSFGTSDKPMKIEVRIFCLDSEQNQFIMKKKTVKIDS